MLKIKKNVDLKVLEKFDDLEYKPNKQFNQPYYVNSSGTVLIWVKSRKLELIQCSSCRNEYDILYDLIKANIITEIMFRENTFKVSRI